MIYMPTHGIIHRNRIRSEEEQHEQDRLPPLTSACVLSRREHGGLTSSDTETPLLLLDEDGNQSLSKKQTPSLPCAPRRQIQI